MFSSSKYEKYSKYTCRMTDNCLPNSFLSSFTNFTARAINENIDLIEKTQRREEDNQGKKVPTEPSVKEINELRNKIDFLMKRINEYEEEQKELDMLNSQQNTLKENYNKLEEKYLFLENVIFFLY